MDNKKQEKLIVGISETLSLPSLGLPSVVARIDTGAKTSALHVEHLMHKTSTGIVSFYFSPQHHSVEEKVRCEAEVHDVRWVKSSNGKRERRYVIKTPVELQGNTWIIEVTLTDRSNMSHKMLLGREGLRKGILVDPTKKFVASNTD